MIEQKTTSPERAPWSADEVDLSFRLAFSSSRLSESTSSSDKPDAGGGATGQGGGGPGRFGTAPLPLVTIGTVAEPLATVGPAGRFASDEPSPLEHAIHEQAYSRYREAMSGLVPPEAPLG